MERQIPWMSLSLRLRNSSSCLRWLSSLKSSSSTSGFFSMHDRNIASSRTCRCTSVYCFHFTVAVINYLENCSQDFYDGNVFVSQITPDSAKYRRNHYCPTAYCFSMAVLTRHLLPWFTSYKQTIFFWTLFARLWQLYSPYFTEEFRRNLGQNYSVTLLRMTVRIPFVHRARYRSLP